MAPRFVRSQTQRRRARACARLQPGPPLWPADQRGHADVPIHPQDNGAEFYGRLLTCHSDYGMLSYTAAASAGALTASSADLSAAEMRVCSASKHWPMKKKP